MPNYKSDVFEAPGQVTHPGDASKGTMTDKDGIIYQEKRMGAREFMAGQGAMGFERNQGATRVSYTAPEPEGGTMGQKKLQTHKETGSHAI